MTKDYEVLVERLSREAVPLLPDAVRARTLSLARGNLSVRSHRTRLRRFAETPPPLYLVPSVLISAAAVFVVDVVLKAARHFWQS